VGLPSDSPGPSVDSSLQARDVLISGVMLMSGATKGGDEAVLMSDVNRHCTGASVFFLNPTVILLEASVKLWSHVLNIQGMLN
jgi:hypothetical protein